jgi:hypothetical protein
MAASRAERIAARLLAVGTLRPFSKSRIVLSLRSRIKRRLAALERDSKAAAKTVSDVKDTIPALAAATARIAEVERDTRQRLDELEATWTSK